ncbi:hypothetical protein AB2B38_013305 [Balneola sp. MJW-20]|uniref:hypothetical protein n=1 Tax=Gracilimonas aurantiaca TaxID=3234185 RepID=UPI003465B73B
MDTFLTFFFRGVVLLFTIASTFLAVYSIQNKWRLRNVRISWRNGKMGGYPLFSTVFLLLITILFVISFRVNGSERLILFGAYFWIGCMWFISSYLASKHYITDYGIVKNINDPSQTIPWYQVMDYVETRDGSGHQYTFSYNLDNGSYNQLKILIPASRHKAFKKIVSYKLEKRFEGQSLPDIDLKRLQEE